MGTKGLALLRIGEIFLVLEEENRINHPNFVYNEHQCPSNLFRSVTMVFDSTGRDPHGVTSFVASIDATPEAQQALSQAKTLDDLFTLFGTDGMPTVVDDD